MASSNRTYESKWKLFAFYCSSRDIDPFTARPAQVADFLFWVARTRGASLSTLAGYRSALGHVLRLTTGYCPGTCPVLRQLMQSFKRTQPLPSNRIPSWDINLVLATLCDPKFSNDHLSLHLLTAKAVFLLALASGERRSALAACAYPPTFDQDGMHVSFCRDFVPKSYFVRKNQTAILPLFIPFVSDDNSLQVCPCRTMLFYLDTVAALRSPTQRSLFIPHVAGSGRNVTPQGISRYVVHLVRWAYDVAGAASPDCRAHDVRKIAASLRALSGDSLLDVLQAGQWSSPFTFLKHYFVSLDAPTNPARQAACVAGRSISTFSF